MKISCGIITETWLTDGEGLDEDIEDLLLGLGIKLHCLNRAANDKGFSHGGVAVFHQNEAMNLKLHNPGKYEVLMVAGTVKGYSRKLVMIACYLPPNYKTARARRAMDYIAGCVTKAKRDYTDPFVVVAGDFNQWQVQDVLEDFVDMEEARLGPTRDGRSIDSVFTNFHDKVIEARTLPPLETDDQN